MINQKLREAVYRKKEIDVSELSPRISLLLDHSIHDIEAYVRPDIIEEMQRETKWGRTPTTKGCNLAIDFAVCQILQDIEIPKFQRILICGTDDAGLLTSRLKNLQQEKGMFDLVIHVKASSCKSARDIEDVIARELGLSTSSRQEVDGLLKSKSFLILLDDVDLASSTNLNDVGPIGGTRRSFKRWFVQLALWEGELITQKLISRLGWWIICSHGSYFVWKLAMLFIFQASNALQYAWSKSARVIYLSLF